MENIPNNPKEKGRTYFIYMVQRQIGFDNQWSNLMAFTDKAAAESYKKECDMIPTSHSKFYRISDELLKL